MKQFAAFFYTFKCHKYAKYMLLKFKFYKKASIAYILFSPSHFHFFLPLLPFPMASKFVDMPLISDPMKHLPLVNVQTGIIIFDNKAVLFLFRLIKN